MLGYHTEQQVVVQHALGPGPNAEHRRTGFRADVVWQRERIAELYENSGRRLQLLGDWHTHPGADQAQLSTVDVRALGKLARDARARCRSPVMWILSGGDEDWEGSAWRFQRGRWWCPKVVPLSIKIH